MAKLLNALLSGNKNIPVEKTLAQVMAIDPTSVKAGTTFLITNYGVTTAESDGTKWRLGRLYSTWANKPAAGVVPVGTELSVSDLNLCLFFSDGNNWKPANGNLLLKQATSAVSSPLAILSGVTAGQFTLPGGNVKIPAGMLRSGYKIRTEALCIKSGAIAVFGLASRLGVTGLSTTDSPIGSVAGTLTPDSASVRLDNYVIFAGSKTIFTRSGNTAPMGQSVGNIADFSANINTDADMFVSFDVINGNVGDTYKLLSYSVWLEG